MGGAVAGARLASRPTSPNITTICTKTNVTIIRGCPARYSSGPGMAAENSVRLARFGGRSFDAEIVEPTHASSMAWTDTRIGVSDTDGNRRLISSAVAA
jgi:hypothetical protein